MAGMAFRILTISFLFAFGMMIMTPEIITAKGKHRDKHKKRHKHLKKARKSLEKALDALEDGKVRKAEKKVRKAIKELRKGGRIYGGHRKKAIEFAKKAKRSRNADKMGSR